MNEFQHTTIHWECDVKSSHLVHANSDLNHNQNDHNINPMAAKECVNHGSVTMWWIDTARE